MSNDETLHRGYVYLIVSQGVALCLGVLIYGCFIWV